MRLLFLPFLLVVSIIKSWAIDFSLLNTNYWYNNPAIRFEHKIAQLDSEIHLFIRLQGLSKDVEVNYLIQDDFEDPNHKDFEIFEIDSISRDGGNVSYKLTFDLQESSVLVAYFQHNNQVFYYPIILDVERNPFPPFYFLDENSNPEFGKAISSESKMSFLNEPSTAVAFQYLENFPPADPPMGNVQIVSPSLEIDSVLSLPSGGLSPNYFYFIQQDTFSNVGLTVYCAPSYFPKQRKLDELITPLTYITKQSELNKITKGSDPKKAFDNFWLKTYSTSNSARAAIRSFYNKISISNAFFTDYKEGWKTDRGIIFIVFGPPDSVSRFNNAEIWTYADGIEFEFRVLSNLFARELFVLKKDPKYSERWIERVKTLRSVNGQ